RHTRGGRQVDLGHHQNHHETQSRDKQREDLQKDVPNVSRTQDLGDEEPERRDIDERKCEDETVREEKPTKRLHRAGATAARRRGQGVACFRHLGNLELAGFWNRRATCSSLSTRDSPTCLPAWRQASPG